MKQVILRSDDNLWDEAAAYVNLLKWSGKYPVTQSDEQLYSTGDIASWTPDGEIMLFGRADNQIKLRGLRIELQEIASCLEAFPGIQAAVAKVFTLHDQQVLGAYYCADEKINEEYRTDGRKSNINNVIANQYGR